MAKFSVIIPAAGRGERFGGSENKTFAKLDGRPIFLRTVGLFVNHPDVCQTILAVAPSEMAAMKTQYGANLGFMGIKLVEGGETRCDTVSLALKAVADEAEFIAVHDAVRPCVAPEQIDAVFTAAMKTGAAILAAPIHGTIKKLGQGMTIQETLPRTRLYEAQTPQVFRKDIIISAYGRAAGQKDKITDDAQVVEMAGVPVSVVESDDTNLKITTKGDLLLAGAILRVRPAKAVPRMGTFEEAQW